MAPNIIEIADNSLAPIEDEAGERLQLLIFGAPWCVRCKTFAPAIDDIAASHRNVVAVAKIDIESSPEIAATFDVRGVPTVIIRHEGELLLRHFGELSRTRLSMMLEDALDLTSEGA